MERAVQLKPLEFCGCRIAAWSELQRVYLAKAYYGLGAAYVQLGRRGAAIAAFERAAATYPPNTASPWMYFLLATQYVDDQRWESAREALHSSLAIKPDYAEARELLSRIERRR